MATAGRVIGERHWTQTPGGASGAWSDDGQRALSGEKSGNWTLLRHVHPDHPSHDGAPNRVVYVISLLHLRFAEPAAERAVGRVVRRRVHACAWIRVYG